jgi:arylsulfatase A
MRALQELGLEENTLVIFTTDNGTNHNSIIRYENGRYIKEKVYSRINDMDIPGGKTHLTDWGVRVPTIAVWPAVITEPGICNELIDFSDFLPTFLDLAKLPGPEFETDGRSFAGAITGSGYTPREWVYSQKDAGEGYMIRTDDWKLLGDGRLYDMNSDPLEENPIVEGADTPESSLARTGLDSILLTLRKGND